MHVGVNVNAVHGRQLCGGDAGSGDDDHPEAGNDLLSVGKRLDDAAEQVCSDPGATHGHDAHLVVAAVAEFGPDRLAVCDVDGIKAADVVAGKVEVSLGPAPDRGQVRSEAIGDDVVWRADED